MHAPHRLMHARSAPIAHDVTAQADACSYCMGSIVLISSQIYLISSYFAANALVQKFDDCFSAEIRSTGNPPKFTVMDGLTENSYFGMIVSCLSCLLGCLSSAYSCL
jgi:hypothetical protein